MVSDGRKLAVTHVGKFYPPTRGGMETVLKNLCAGTAGKCEVRAIVANTGARTVRERCSGVTIIRTAKVGTIGPVPLCPGLPFHVWAKGQDCIVLHEPNALAALALALYRRARQFVIWHHSDSLRPGWAVSPYSVLQKVLYRKADCVIFASPTLAEHSAVRTLAKRTAVIPYGLELSQFLQPTRRTIQLAQPLREDSRVPIVLFAGRLVYYKGLEVLLSAMTKCTARLRILGDGPLGPRLKTLAHELGIGDRVLFTGSVSDEHLAAYYHASDVFVLPSTEITEAFGLVQVEAMASGLPVVSTDLPTGVPWVNQHGITGLVVPPGDVDALSEALAMLLEDPQMRKRMGAAGRKRAVEQFSVERMVGDFERLVEEVCG